jgi:hypothetical protein
MAMGIPRNAESWPNGHGFPAFLQAQHSLPLYNEAATRSYMVPPTRMDFNSIFRSAYTQAIPCVLYSFRNYAEILYTHPSTKTIKTRQYVTKTKTSAKQENTHMASRLCII